MIGLNPNSGVLGCFEPHFFILILYSAQTARSVYLIIQYVGADLDHIYGIHTNFLAISHQKVQIFPDVRGPLRDL